MVDGLKPYAELSCYLRCRRCRNAKARRRNTAVKQHIANKQPANAAKVVWLSAKGNWLGPSGTAVLVGVVGN